MNNEFALKAATECHTTKCIDAIDASKAWGCAWRNHMQSVHRLSNNPKCERSASKAGETWAMANLDIVERATTCYGRVLYDVRLVHAKQLLVYVISENAHRARECIDIPLILAGICFYIHSVMRHDHLKRGWLILWSATLRSMWLAMVD